MRTSALNLSAQFSKTENRTQSSAKSHLYELAYVYILYFFHATPLLTEEDVEKIMITENGV